MIAPHLGQRFPVEAQRLDGALSTRILIDGKQVFFSKVKKHCRVVDSGVQEQWLLRRKVVVVSLSPATRVNEREQISFKPLIAYLTTEEQVRPFVGQPVVSGAAKRIVRILAISGLGAIVLDVTVRNVRDFGLAETAFVVLGLQEGIFH